MVKIPTLVLLLHALDELVQSAVLPLVFFKVGLAALQKPIKADFEHELSNKRRALAIGDAINQLRSFQRQQTLGLDRMSGWVLVIPEGLLNFLVKVQPVRRGPVKQLSFFV